MGESDRDCRSSHPGSAVRRLDAVPLVNVDSKLSIALVDPTDSDAVEELEQAASRPLQLAVATSTSIRRTLREILGPQGEPRTILPASAPEAVFDVQWDRSVSMTTGCSRTAVRSVADHGVSQ